MTLVLNQISVHCSEKRGIHSAGIAVAHAFQYGLSQLQFQLKAQELSFNRPVDGFHSPLGQGVRKGARGVFYSEMAGRAKYEVTREGNAKDVRK